MRKNQWTPYIRAMLAGFGAIGLSVAFFFVIYNIPGIAVWLGKINDILAPFIYGGVIAYLLRPMCNGYADMLEKVLPAKMKKLANSLAVVLSMITGLMIVYALIIMIAPQLVESIETIWHAIPERLDQFYNWAVSLVGEEEELLQYLNKLNTGSDTLYAEIERWVSETLIPQFESIWGGVSNIVTGVGSGVMKILNFLLDLVIGVIVAVYLLGSRKRFARQSVMIVRSVFKPRVADLLLEEVKFVDEMFAGFIDGKIIDSAIIGVLCYIGCLIFKFPNALLISVIVGVTNVIPFFGPFIGAVPATLLIMLEDPIKGLWFILFVFVLQQLDGNIIGPKILGDRTGLSSFWVLFAIVLFGGLWGLVGMIIGVPLIAVIYDLVKKVVKRGLRRNGYPDMYDTYAAEFNPPSEPQEAEEEECEENSETPDSTAK
jgi:predicted PurR-regulated permease PerM